MLFLVVVFAVVVIVVVVVVVVVVVLHRNERKDILWIIGFRFLLSFFDFGFFFWNRESEHKLLQH